MDEKGIRPGFLGPEFDTDGDGEIGPDEEFMAFVAFNEATGGSLEEDEEEKK